MTAETERLKISLPVIVEGRYDKSKLAGVIDAHIITTDGFGIFNRKEKLALICRLSQNGVIVLTDSDGAGGVIRGRIMSAVPKDKIYNLYIPQIKGKEKRKAEASKEGTLGVEGMENSLLRRLFTPFAGTLTPQKGGMTKADLFASGLTGLPGSAEKRDYVAKQLGLPAGMTPGAFLGALNLLITKDELTDLTNNYE